MLTALLLKTKNQMQKKYIALEKGLVFTKLETTYKIYNAPCFIADSEKV